MLDFEKFIMAVYDILKSLLNIKIKQLESKVCNQNRHKIPVYNVQWWNFFL